jgi:drug/metabolite transporter (DMT)-like permease
VYELLNKVRRRRGAFFDYVTSTLQDISYKERNGMDTLLSITAGAFLISLFCLLIASVYFKFRRWRNYPLSALLTILGLFFLFANMINDSFPPRNTDAFIAFAGGSVISIVLFLMAFRVYKGGKRQATN